MSIRLIAATPAMETAAAELSAYLTKLGLSADTLSVTLCEDTALPLDGLRITVKDGEVTLSGGNGRGVLYAVYRLLEELGCRFYAEDTEVIPTMTPAEAAAILHDGLDIAEVSPFEYRDLYWTCTYRPDFAVKRRINAGRAGTRAHKREIPPEWGDCLGYAGPHFVHTFAMLVPPDEFFETHPEYFSMIDGERSAKHLYSQLCLSNPDVLAITVERVKGWLREI